MAISVDKDQSLKDAFNAPGGYEFRKLSNSLLRVMSDGAFYKFDFALCVMTTRASDGVALTPFSQLDRETLVEMRDRLVALGGKPPALPDERHTGPVLPRKLNP